MLAPPEREDFPRRSGDSLRWTGVLHLCFPAAQRGLFLPRRTHTRCLGRRPHTAATRASWRGAGARHTRRVDRDDFFNGGKIGTNGPFQADEALPVALSERYENTGLP